MTLLAQGMAALTAQMLAHSGERIVYCRDGDSCELYATPGRSDLEVSEGDTVIHIESQDFLIDPSHLVLGLQMVEPREGDIILLRRRYSENVHEVLPLGDGRAFTTDPHRTSMRIRTRLKETRPI